MVDVKTVREKHGLTQKEFVRELVPLMKKRMSIITVDILKTIESGGKIDPARLELIVSSINERFSDVVKAEPKKRITSAQRRIAMLFTIFAIFIFSILIYLFTPMRSDLTNIVSIVSGLAGILGLSLTLFNSKHR